MNDQSSNLRRVRSRLAGAVLRFCASRLLMGCPDFRGADLQAYVRETVTSAPASPDRILRLLRREGRLSYEVTDRAGSAYRVLAVNEESHP